MHKEQPHIEEDYPTMRLTLPLDVHSRQNLKTKLSLFDLEFLILLILGFYISLYLLTGFGLCICAMFSLSLLCTFIFLLCFYFCTAEPSRRIEMPYTNSSCPCFSSSWKISLLKQ